MNYEQKYKEAIVKLRELFNSAEDNNETLDLWFNDFVNIFPELKESEDERIRKDIISFVEQAINAGYGIIDKKRKEKWIAWLEKQGNLMKALQISNAKIGDLIEENYYLRENLEKQGDTKETLCDKCRKEQPSHSCQDITELGRCALEKQSEQKPTMIQWKGNNLKEVIDFTGIYKDRFEKWFHNSWEEYEKYVHEHNNIFKIFNEDGSHIEIPVGAWIVKTPDGYNTASRYVFRQKSAWSEEDEKYLDAIEKLIIGSRHTGYNGVSRKDAADWFKSLKDRYTWKPSNEQMDALYTYIYNPQYFNSQDPRMELVESVYQDLKKLREE